MVEPAGLVDVLEMRRVGENIPKFFTGTNSEME